MITQEISLIGLTGCLSLMFSIGIALCLTGIHYLKLRFLGRLLPGHTNLIKAHVDFAIMAALLFSLYLLFLNLKIDPPRVIVYLLSAGALTNPCGFVVLSMTPLISREPLSPFGLFMTFSFSSSTIGFAGTAFLIAKKLVA